MTEAEVELGEEVFSGKEAFDAMLLLALRIENQNRRGPLRAEALERLRLLFDVEPSGDEVPGDELTDAGIGINLGFQPSASPSHRCGGEIEQERLPCLLRLRQSGIDVADPFDGHG